MNVVFGNVRFRPQRGNRLIAVDLCVRLGRDNARPTALDCECLEGRDCSLGVVRVGNHAHLHLHRVRGQIDDDITAPPAVEKMHMGIVRQHLRNRIVWRAV